MLNKEEVGKRIAFFRKEKGITQRELADFLHISYQAVSKWELGKSLPTVDILYEISGLLDVSVDMLLNENDWKNRSISYRSTGLDTRRLYDLKCEIKKLNSKDKSLLYSDFADICMFQPDTSQMKEPVYSCVTCVPGSKEKLAKEYGYNKEICAAAAASAINYTLQHGMKPMILKSMVICGNYNQEQLYLMAQSFRKICDKNNISFAGMEIAAQPINFTSEEYSVNATVVGVADKEKLLTRSCVEKGDVLIGIKTEGIDGTNYPFIKIMLDRNPGLYHAKIDENKFFLDELMKANSAYTREITALQEYGYLKGAFRMSNSLMNDGIWRGIPKGLGACIDLSALPVMPLYKFLFEQGMIGENVFHYHFHMGISMVVAVKEKDCKDALKVISQFSECWRIGQVESNDGHEGRKVWGKGKISWKS
ncbi:MAG: helix-turn-helix domain-containing protein [Lachnospiraceae bacterium]|nr:helix-turn-helix domain-containing protein [Lachnospiraceae bacterium]